MKKGGALPLLLGASAALVGFHFYKVGKKSQVVDQVFMQAQASDNPELVEQAVVVMRANGNEPAAKILEIHLRTLRGAA